MSADSDTTMIVPQTKHPPHRHHATLITIYELASALGVSHVDLVRPTRAWLKAQSKPLSAKRPRKTSGR